MDQRKAATEGAQIGACATVHTRSRSGEAGGLARFLRGFSEDTFTDVPDQCPDETCPHSFPRETFYDLQ